MRARLEWTKKFHFRLISVKWSLILLSIVYCFFVCFGEIPSKSLSRKTAKKSKWSHFLCAWYFLAWVSNRNFGWCVVLPCFLFSQLVAYLEESEQPAATMGSRNVECRKFSPNIFNKSKCTHCFRQREEHSAAALECNRVSSFFLPCTYEGLESISRCFTAAAHVCEVRPARLVTVGWLTGWRTTVEDTVPWHAAVLGKWTHVLGVVVVVAAVTFWVMSRVRRNILRASLRVNNFVMNLVLYFRFFAGGPG